MCLRMKATHYWGISKSGIYDPRAPVLPGCYKEHERRALNAKYGRISATAFEKEKKAIYGEHPRRRLATPNLLTIYLHHGDMVIMHGAEMQKYYEVCFNCGGPRTAIANVLYASSIRSCLRTSSVLL